MLFSLGVTVPLTSDECSHITTFNWSTLKQNPSPQQGNVFALWDELGGNFENLFFLMPRQREGKHWHSCPLLVFAPLLSIRSFLWFSKWGVLERQARSSVKPLCWHQRKKERERERWRKTKRQSGLLKSSRASAGATERVQAQLCNKEQRGWMRETEEWGEGGGCWWKAPSDVSLCSVPLSSSHPLMETHTRIHAHSHIGGRREESDIEIKRNMR